MVADVDMTSHSANQSDRSDDVIPAILRKAKKTNDCCLCLNTGDEVALFWRDGLLMGVCHKRKT